MFSPLETNKCCAEKIAARINEQRAVGTAQNLGKGGDRRHGGHEHFTLGEVTGYIFESVKERPADKQVDSGRCQSNGGSSTCSTSAISRGAIYTARARHSAKAAERLRL